MFSDVSSASRLRSVCRLVHYDFCEARIEACVDEVCGDVRNLASRPYHVTDSGLRLWRASVPAIILSENQTLYL